MIAAFAPPPNYNLSNHREYIILMTDGDNDEFVKVKGKDDKNQPTFYDDAAKASCQALRNQGIEIFSVAFLAGKKARTYFSIAHRGTRTGIARRGNDPGRCDGAGRNPDARDVTECAGRDMKTDKTSYYFTASNPKELEDAFRKIGLSINTSQVWVKQ